MKQPRVVIVVQARMGSTRLPGKVLMDLEGKPMLERQLERLARARTTEAVVVATTTEPRDQPIVDLAARLRVSITRGDEEDVLGRFVDAAKEYSADVIVRVTADCPLVDPDILDRCVATLVADPSLDYVSNTLERTFPRGLDVEVVRRNVLETAASEATEPLDREHVTRFVWRHPERFRLGSMVDANDNSHLRWTVDTAEDLAVVRRIFGDLLPRNPHFGYADVLLHAREFPDTHALNAHVTQKA